MSISSTKNPIHAVAGDSDAAEKDEATPPKRVRTAKPRARAESSAKLNFIQPAPTAVKAKAEAVRSEGVRRAPAPDANGIERPLDTESMPAAVRGRYAQDGNRYLFPSGDRAFEDQGKRLTTPSENTTVIRDLIAIASARGWTEIKIGGTKGFRTEAWRAAKLAGLEVVGYKPSRTEQALLIHTLGRRDMEADPAHPPGPVPDPRSETAALITGRLLEHGAARYRQDPEEAMSYFVRLKTGRDAEREIWGVDLERAIKQSLTDVQIGDDIGLRAVERKEFRLKTHRRDETGEKVPTEIEAHRNGWIVEQRRFFNDRIVLAKTFRDSTIKPSDGYRRHPELKGSYLELQAAKLRFEEVNSNPEDRAKFLTRLRERMAAAMERGEPLTPVRMRERAPDKDSLVKASTVQNPEHLFTR